MYPSERFKGLDVFLCVVEAGSFVAAAERLHLTSSAVGKAIARLEGRLGHRLLERSTRRMTLTEAGAAFHHTCTEVMARLEDAELAMRDEDVEPKGHVRLSLPGAFGRLQVMPHILRFAREYPAVQPVIDVSDRFVDPVEERMDIVVRIGGAGVWPAGMEHRVLGHEQHVFCASPGYLAEHGTPTTREALASHRCIAYGRTDGSASVWRFADAQPVVARVQMVVGDGEAQASAVLAGCGIAQLPAWLIRGPVEDGSLRIVLPEATVEGLPLAIGWDRRRRQLPKVGLLLDVLLDELGDCIRQAPGPRGG